VDTTTDYHRDALYCPSLYATKMVPMPASLARYAAVFYLSSLVRYRPDRLDPMIHGGDAWLMDSLADASPVQIMAASLNWLRSTTFRYDYSRSMG
jgi:hypothetical protein